MRAEKYNEHLISVPRTQSSKRYMEDSWMIGGTKNEGEVYVVRSRARSQGW